MKEGTEAQAIADLRFKKQDLVYYPETRIISRKEFIIEAGELTLANLNKPDTDKETKEWRMYQKAYMDKDFKRPIKDKDVWDAYKTYLRS